MSESAVYRTLAEYYDRLMDHVDYDRWSRHIARLCGRHGLRPRLVLELAAGTCPFHRRPPFPAARCVYSDLSPAMLRHALPPEDRAHADRVAADALALPFRFPRGADLCLMIYDSINYLLEEEELARLLKEVRAQLRQGGLFIFDATTEANSRRHFRDTTSCEDRPECTVVRHSEYDPQLRLQYNDFLLFVPEGGGRYLRRVENHLQRIYPLQTFARLARGGGFSMLGGYENFTLRPARESSARVHFVLRRDG